LIIITIIPNLMVEYLNKMNYRISYFFWIAERLPFGAFSTLISGKSRCFSCSFCLAMLDFSLIRSLLWRALSRTGFYHFSPLDFCF